METEFVNRKVREALGQFESLPEIQTSPAWNEALERRLLSSARRRKVQPGFVIAVVLLVLINAGIMLKVLLPVNTVTAQNNYRLQVVAENILINPDSANN